MPLLYIAGPYRSKTINGIYHNIHQARLRMEWAWRNKWVPICPHLNSAFIDGIVPDEVILAGYIQVLSKCDGIMLIEGWYGSAGSVAEYNFALEHGIPMIDDPFQPPII